MTILLVLVVTVCAQFGANRLGFSSDIREIFRSGSPDFATLEQVARQYPGTGRDILIAVEGKDLFQPAVLENLRALHLDLGFVEAIGYVLSPFSARTPPDAKGGTESVVPAELSDTEDMAALRQQLLGHPLVSGKLLSSDGRLCLFVLSLKGPNRGVDELRRVIGEVETLAKDILKDSDVDIRLTGASVMRVEILGALIRDQKTFRIAGLTIAVLFCWLFFRSIPYVVIALAPAVAAITWLRGTMAFMGQDINVLTNVIPSLVMVIAFASAMHVLFSVRRGLGRELSLEDSIKRAILQVGPACVLASATTALALLALVIVPHPFIIRFGLTAAFGTALAYIAIMTTLPPLCRLLIGRIGSRGKVKDRSDWIHRGVHAISRTAARWVRARPAMIFVGGALLTVVSGWLYTLNTPQYQYQDNLPKGNPAFGAIQLINAKLSGADTLRLLIQWPREYELDSTATLDLIRSTHEIFEAEPAIKAVSSLFSAERWFVAGGRDRKDLLGFLKKARSPLSSRVMAPDNHSALVTGNFTSLPAAELVAIITKLDLKLDQLRERNPSVKFSLTGLTPVSAKASTEMIQQLNRSLLIAVCAIILLIGLAMRSVWAGLVSILPNLLPITLVGAGLYLFGKGLQFTSVVAFTIGFGMAVDSTIHVLNRYRLEKAEDADAASAMEKTIAAIGPVLIVSTLVLASGVGGTMLSEMPMVRLYGEVIVVLLTTALAGALLLLPAIIRIVDRWRRKETGGRSSGEDLPRPAASAE
ncbi:MAG: efflux RND transporter permease subunit [Geminicoccaceae bacterium]